MMKSVLVIAILSTMVATSHATTDSKLQEYGIESYHYIVNAHGWEAPFWQQYHKNPIRNTIIWTTLITCAGGIAVANLPEPVVRGALAAFLGFTSSIVAVELFGRGFVELPLSKMNKLLKKLKKQ